jgi:hypothetical protein
MSLVTCMNPVFHLRMASPAISVVIATYNRSRALGYAIESVLGQTFRDWELIVVGDACTDDTAEVVARYASADPRVRFVNLERNWGEQSGPNNVGRALARAPLIAYLSHDDIWLPHHLKACSEALAITGADLVLGTAASISFEGARLGFDSLQVLLQGLGEGHRWSPADLDASVAVASCWLIRVEALDKIGGWRMSQKDRAEPSQALLFRLWRRAFHIHTLNDLTLIVIGAGHRAKSYLERETPEHDWIAEQMSDPAFACEIAARVPSSNAFTAGRWPRRPPFWRRAIAGALAHLGINPRGVTMAMRHGWKRGANLRYLRERSGLQPIAAPGAAPLVRAEAVRRACLATIGAPINFGAGAGGARYLASGWAVPESDGCWSDGPLADLMFDIGQPPTTDLRFEFTFSIFQKSQGAAREVVIETVRGDPIGRWTLSVPGGDWSIIVPASAWIGSRIGLRLRFAETISPKQLGLSDDPRALGLKLHRVCISPP